MFSTIPRSETEGNETAATIMAVSKTPSQSSRPSRKHEKVWMASIALVYSVRNAKNTDLPPARKSVFLCLSGRCPNVPAHSAASPGKSGEYPVFSSELTLALASSLGYVSFNELTSQSSGMIPISVCLSLAVCYISIMNSGDIVHKHLI